MNGKHILNTLPALQGNKRNTTKFKIFKTNLKKEGECSWNAFIQELLGPVEKLCEQELLPLCNLQERLR